MRVKFPRANGSGPKDLRQHGWHIGADRWPGSAAFASLSVNFGDEGFEAGQMIGELGPVGYFLQDQQTCRQLFFFKACFGVSHCATDRGMENYDLLGSVGLMLAGCLLDRLRSQSGAGRI